MTDDRRLGRRNQPDRIRGKIYGGCPDGWWALSNCLHFQALGWCRAPLADRPTVKDAQP